MEFKEADLIPAFLYAANVLDSKIEDEEIEILLKLLKSDKETYMNEMEVAYSIRNKLILKALDDKFMKYP